MAASSRLTSRVFPTACTAVGQADRETRREPPPAAACSARAAEASWLIRTTRR